MVMHARKLPRLNDGYYDRNQAHPYENTSKYSKSTYGERYNDKAQDSPSNGSNCGRSESPDNRYSPRYQGKSSYTQRLKERERERQDKGSNRSPCNRDRSSRNSSGSSSSAGNKDHPQSVSSSSSSSRGAEGSSCSHRSNHEKNQNEEKEKRIQVGDWSEHTSSSGKKYYYNCKTEVSQWEKPKEWIEWEKQQCIHKSSDVNKSKDRSDRTPSSGNRSMERHSADKTCRIHQQQQQQHQHHSSFNQSDGDRHTHQPASSSRSSASSMRNSHQQPQRTNNRGGGSSGHSHYKGDGAVHGDGKTEHGQPIRNERHDLHGRKNSDDSQMQDMDISPGSSIGTPLSGGHAESNSQTPLLQSSAGITASTASVQGASNPVAPSDSHRQAQSQLLSPSQATLADLPKLISQLAGTRGLPNLSELSPQDALRTIQQALQLTKQVTSLAQTNALSHQMAAAVTLPPMDSLTQKSPSPLPPVTLACHPLPGNQHSSQQLPTTLGQPILMDDKIDDRGRSSPGSDYSTHSSRHGSPSSSISSLHSLTGTATSSLASAVQKPSLPTLTPSLANYYKEELISHVTGWQADHAERQANRYSEEAHSIGSLNCTRVSAELKMARSLVRLAEIQATLQEQRVLEYEKWKLCIRNVESHPRWCRTTPNQS